MDIVLAIGGLAMLIVAFICFIALVVAWFFAPNGEPAAKPVVAKAIEVPAAS